MIPSPRSCLLIVRTAKVFPERGLLLARGGMYLVLHPLDALDPFELPLHPLLAPLLGGPLPFVLRTLFSQRGGPIPPGKRSLVRLRLFLQGCRENVEMVSWGLWLRVFRFAEIHGLFVANRELRVGWSRVKAENKGLQI